MKKNSIFIEYNIYNIWKKQYNRTELEYIDRGGVKIRRRFELRILDKKVIYESDVR